MGQATTVEAPQKVQRETCTNLTFLSPHKVGRHHSQQGTSERNPENSASFVGRFLLEAALGLREGVFEWGAQLTSGY